MEQLLQNTKDFNDQTAEENRRWLERKEELDAQIAEIDAKGLAATVDDYKQRTYLVQQRETEEDEHLQKLAELQTDYNGKFSEEAGKN